MNNDLTSFDVSDEQLIIKNANFNEFSKLYYVKRGNSDFTQFTSIYTDGAIKIFTRVFDEFFKETSTGLTRFNVFYKDSADSNYIRLPSNLEKEITHFDYNKTTNEAHHMLKFYTTLDGYVAIAKSSFNKGHVLTQIDDENYGYITSINSELANLYFQTPDKIYPINITKVSKTVKKFSLNDITKDFENQSIKGKLMTIKLNMNGTKVIKTYSDITCGLSKLKIPYINNMDFVLTFFSDEQQSISIINTSYLTLKHSVQIIDNEIKLQPITNPFKEIILYARGRQNKKEYIELTKTSGNQAVSLVRDELFDQLQFHSMGKFAFYDFFYSTSSFSQKIPLYIDEPFSQETFNEKHSSIYKIYTKKNEALTIELKNHQSKNRAISGKIITINHDFLEIFVNIIANDISLLVKSRKFDERFVISGEFVDDFLVRFQWSELITEWSSSHLGRFYDLYLIANQDGLEIMYRFEADFETLNERNLIDNETKKILNSRHRYLEMMSLNKVSNSIYNQTIKPYITLAGEFSIYKARVYNILKTQYLFQAEVTDVLITKNGLYVEIVISSNLENSHLIYKDITLVNRNRLIENVLSFNTVLDTKKNGSIVAKSFITVDSMMTPFYYDIFIEACDPEIYGESFFLPVGKVADVVKNTLSDAMFNSFKPNGEFVFYPYISNISELSFEYRLLESFENENNWEMELRMIKDAPYYKSEFLGRNIWLIFEKNSLGAHDNAFQFFQYIMDNKLRDDVFFVIDPSSPDYKFVAPYSSNVIEFMSKNYFLYVYFASLLISSDTKYHIYNTHVRHSPMGKLISAKKLVYLQHGINGIKRVPAFHKSSKLLDFVTVPSYFEKDMVKNEWGYKESEVAVTGFARFDNYYDLTHTTSIRRIFVMPTWRKWMDGMNHDEFILTDFYKIYDNFLSSPRLKRVLRKYNAKISFFLHPYFKDYIDLFDTDSEIIEKFGYLDVDMGEEIQKSSIMITDYSSIAWDMFYLSRPVVFFQFDQVEYLATEGSYMDFDNDLFGDVVLDCESLINSIVLNLEGECELSDKYLKLREKYFTFTDRENRHRIFEAIKDFELTI